MAATTTAAPAGAILTSDGGARVPGADLWCSYAAVRALRWLGERPADPDAVAGYLLSRRNPDGGFAWQRGLPSDIWATYYCTQALADLGHMTPTVDALAAWVPRLRAPDGGFGMTPGAPADVWATYYATRTHAEILHAPLPRRAALRDWLAACQTTDGGIAWQPGGREADVRAAYYAAVAWRMAAGGPGSAAGGHEEPLPFARGPLVAWLHERQGPDGGIAFAPGMAPCAWAAFRAVRALAALDTAPAAPGALAGWLRARRLPGGGYERWAGYGRSDVWACFCTVGALLTLGELAPADTAGTADVVRGYQLPGSGFTYRPADAAGDSLATAAALLCLPAGDPLADRLAGWLRAAQLPYEDGVMYMPGRGAEIRCTLWAAAALRAHGASLDVGRLGAWLRQMQNVDGGFGYWHGRGSDLVSTVCALELATTSGLPTATVLDLPAATRFLLRAGDGGPDGDEPDGRATTAALALRARGLALAASAAGTSHGRAVALAHRLAERASPLGGYAATARAVPDLATTYQVVRTQQQFGLPVDAGRLRRFLQKVRAGDGYAWSPLGREPGGPLATALGTQLARVAVDPSAVLPPLNL